MNNRILIFDFGSQYTQLIARRIRELSIYCEIVPFNTKISDWSGIKGIILSGSPASVNIDTPVDFSIEDILDKVPILGIAYGAQYIAQSIGGTIQSATDRTYKAARLKEIDNSSPLFKEIRPDSQVWMSFGSEITELSSSATLSARLDNGQIAAFQIKDKDIYGVQFHPEVSNTEDGLQLFRNFAVGICQCSQDWTAEIYIKKSIKDIRSKVGEDKVVLGLSGGVDSSVAALLLHKAIGHKLTCIFINNGLLRKNEYDEVLESYKTLGLNVIGVDASQYFLDALKGVTDPEGKRKAIGKSFIDIFQEQANSIEDVHWLAQGTIYPDVIESVSINDSTVKVKSHHNVGGLPEKMSLKLVEPLRMLFKDEVRKVGHALNLPEDIINRHPFPGPALSIRILGEVTREKVATLQKADSIFINGLKKANLYNKIWQAGVVLLPVQSVGVIGDQRTYENVVALRAITSTDGMTADWYPLPYDFMAEISNEIIYNVDGVNRVVYDISSKPPATIEWE
ncbi:MAG TPA: glutamine-hydrolyzing GMP synthase [Chitinophagales bacterium]|nr:glutamine-hydrolyzing GMP synthase [Chitinophagales bacterium]